MNDFFPDLAVGRVKASGVMNYIQHEFVARRCKSGATVLDVCCGRGLLIPILRERCPLIKSYTGVDISAENLEQLKRGHASAGDAPFSITTHELDVAYPDFDLAQPFDIVIYTSALEHMPRDAGIRSLHFCRRAISPGGIMYLSTPITPSGSPIQYKVHIHEWDIQDLRTVLEQVGFQIMSEMGLLIALTEDTARAISDRYGDGAAQWYRRLEKLVPEPFLNTVVAAALPEVSSEILFVCQPK